ncbi:MAG: type I glyceraldehyde-3-phosphate dehydrogenase [Anaerolineae bacterium]|nr:type I glyceraldehyde-3-phosphate dehydrogenase [Anaerolineae bacterium]NUQ02547.1 type I glyceraldehyde-3-phosphate dehydrogenase [Anaerolineae bacterium]
MAIRIGINGFGRIGRLALRTLRERYAGEIDIIAFNDLGDLDTMAHLFKYDSNYGRYSGTIEKRAGALIIDGDELKALSEKDPAAIPWGDLGCDIVIESTGRFTDKETASKHLAGGAKKVIISAPAKNEDITICLGVNEEMYDPSKHHIVSNASCTTNCLAPAAKVVNDNFGIQRALMTTIHSYTNDQQILDLPHKDLRRARAAAVSMIPTTTGAAKAVSLVIPELKGKFDGFAIRVPTPTVSLVDFVADLEKPTTTADLIAAFEAASKTSKLDGILGVSHEPLVSVDYRGDSRSSIIDAQSTQVMGGTMAKVVTWYDNEWGYSCRIADLVKYMGDRL